jgi:hypothetical protein
MRPGLDPADLSANERVGEVASILAAGILRLRARAALSTELAENSHSKILLESRQDCLEVS